MSPHPSSCLFSSKIIYICASNSPSYTWRLMPTRRGVNMPGSFTLREYCSTSEWMPRPSGCWSRGALSGLKVALVGRSLVCTAVTLTTGWSVSARRGAQQSTRVARAHPSSTSAPAGWVTTLWKHTLHVTTLAPRLSQNCPSATSRVVPATTANVNDLISPDAREKNLLMELSSSLVCAVACTHCSMKLRGASMVTQCPAARVISAHPASSGTAMNWRLMWPSMNAISSNTTACSVLGTGIGRTRVTGTRKHSPRTASAPAERATTSA
mmetsp:Transcript_32940/g.63282  ORF Transcript_32940/g.63282 Transcript_32940/m.63282 type:complete len:268 (+) Transcript_32940:1478-2281(+)